MTDAKCQACRYRLGHKEAEGVRINRTGIVSAWPAVLLCPRCRNKTEFRRPVTTALTTAIQAGQ